MDGRAKMIRIRRIPSSKLEELAKAMPSYRDRKRKRLTLAEMCEYRPLRIIADGGSVQGAAFFATVFRGLMIHPSGDKVRILRFRHPVDAGNVFSYALFVPAFGIISNASEYWVLKGIATDHSGTAGQTHRIIEGFIKTHRNRVTLSEYEIPETDFEKELEDPLLRGLRSRIKANEELLGALRGNLLEALVASHFALLNYELKGLRRRLGSMDGMEIDVVAVLVKGANTEIVLAQCKGRLRRALGIIELNIGREKLEQDREMKKVHRFSKAVEGVVADSSRLLQELCLDLSSYSKVRVRGVVVSTNITKAEVLQEFPSNLELWAWEDWSKEFRRSGLDGSLFEPIERIIRNDRPGRRILTYWQG